MGENVGFSPTREVEQRTCGNEVEAGFGQLDSVFTSQSLIQLLLQPVKVANVARRIFALRVIDLRGAPVARLLLLREIVAEARARWETGEVAVVHRIGRLEIGETSVAIAVAAPHRAEAYEASRYIIEELKKRVPVWKREGYLDGESEWLMGTVPQPAGEQA